MLPEKPYLRQIGLLEVGKFAKKPYFCSFTVVPKEPHLAPRKPETSGLERIYEIR
jgi:hypothetical protein